MLLFFLVEPDVPANIRASRARRIAQQNKTNNRRRYAAGIFEDRYPTTSTGPDPHRARPATLIRQQRNRTI
jgi:hypothetical protein